MNEINIDFNALIESVTQMYILLLAGLFILPVLFAFLAYVLLGWVERRLHRRHHPIDTPNSTRINAAHEPHLHN